MFARWKTYLSGFSRPLSGQLVIWILIYISITQTSWVLSAAPTDRNVPVTALSFLPEQILASRSLFLVCRLGLLVGGVLWALQLVLPVSCWLSVGCMTAVVAMSYENSTHISHVYHLTNMVLLIHALWYQFHYREIRVALLKGVFWQSPLYPNWTFMLSVFCIALFHTYAGLSKLVVSGPEWANGVSLQLWVHLWGRDNSFVNELIVSNRQAAIALQVATLVIETTAIAAVFSRWFRFAIGVGLLGLYYGIVESFGFYFKYNAFLVAAFFLPCDQLLDSLSVFLRRRIRIPLTLSGSRFGRRLVKAVVSRVDMFGLIELRESGTPVVTDEIERGGVNNP